MRSKSTNVESSAKRALIESAERLFAMHGFEAVSVRDITHAAGMNVAAVNYHFGSREQLVRLIIASNLGPIDEERRRRLEILEMREGKTGLQIDEILNSSLLPILLRKNLEVSMQQANGKLIGIILTEVMSASGLADFKEHQDINKRFNCLLASKFGEPSVDMIERQASWVMGAVIAELFRDDGNVLESSTANSEEENNRFDQLIDFAAAGFLNGINDALGASDTAEEGDENPQGFFNF